MLDAADLLAWAKAFALTELVEAPIYVRVLPTDLRRALAASAITHPFVWFVFPLAGARLELGWGATSIASEIFAWTAEAAFLRVAAGASWRRAAAGSLLANAASVAIGLSLRAAFQIV